MLIALLGWSACEDKGIGLPCDLPGDGGATATQVVSQAVECPESVCIKMAKRQPVAGDQPQPVAYCTTRCSSDADCEGGENCWSPTGDQQMRFRCVKPVLVDIAEEGAGLACEGICVCEADARVQTNPVLCRCEETGQNCEEAVSIDECEWSRVEPRQCQ